MLIFNSEDAIFASRFYPPARSAAVGFLLSKISHMNEETKHPGGAPTKFKSEYCEQVRKLALLGATDAEIAEFFDVCEATINNWKIDFPEFLESLRAGKIKADSEIANSLYERAKGAEWEEEVAFKVKSIAYEKGKKISEEERIETATVTRRAPPDTQAASLFLRNRRHKDWKEKVEHEHNGKDGTPLVPMIYLPDNGRDKRD